VSSLILALDYPGRRDESRIRDLRLEAAGWQVRYLMTAPFPQALTSSGYAAGLMPAGETIGADVAAVCAYCSGAPIAQEIVSAARPGEPVPLLLFDGEPSLLSGIRRDAAAAANQLGADEAARKSGPAEDFTDQQLAEDPKQCADALREWLVALGMATLRRDGTDEAEARSIATDIACFYLDWLMFLIAAHNTQWPEFDGRLMHVVSRGHRFTERWPGSRVAETCRVDSGRNELLDHPDARERALSFLKQAGTTT
jgi:hypothetical protein